MGITTWIMILLGAVLVIGYVYGTYLERHPEKTATGKALKAAYDAELDAVEQRYAGDARRTAETIAVEIPRLMRETAERAIIETAALYGETVTAPPRTDADRRAYRLARQAERDQYGAPVDLDAVPFTSPVADEWATMTAELVANDSPTEPVVTGPTWWVVTSTVTEDTQWADSAYDAEQAHIAVHPGARIRSCVPARFK